MSLPLLKSSCVNDCVKLLREDGCILPEFKDGDDRPLDNDDFLDAKSTFETYSDRINNLLISGFCSETDSFASANEINEFLTLLIIHCGQHYEESNWTSTNTYESCKSILNLVFGELSNDIYLVKLVSEHGKLLKSILNKLRPCLLSDSWKRYPTAVQCYVWCLRLLRAPYLSEHIDILLPTSLIITDDFTPSNKILGIKCLHHIIINVPFTDLQIRSYEEVIFKALEMSLYAKNADVIISLVPCILSLLCKMYSNPTDHCGKWTHYDDLLDKYLYQLKLEGSIDIKTSLVKSLPAIISSSGLLTVRHLNTIVEVVDECTLNPSTVLLALKVIQEIFVVCSPCLDHHMKQISFIIFKVLYSSTSYKPLPLKDVVESCKNILNSVYLLKPEILTDLKEHSKYSCLCADVRSVVEEVINSNS